MRIAIDALTRSWGYVLNGIFIVQMLICIVPFCCIVAASGRRSY